MKTMLAYIALEFWIQLYNFVSRVKYIREYLAYVLMVWYNLDHITFEFKLLAWLFTCRACPSLISSLPIHHPEPNINEKICFTMPALLLSFCKYWFFRVCGKIPIDYSFNKLCYLAFIHSCLVMLYSNWRRHNSPSIPKIPYQILIIPCPNFDSIYQVILLKNSSEWNLPPAKEGSSKKKREREEQGLKSKRGETSFEKATCFKIKEAMKFTSCWERFYQKKERNEIIFSYSAKSDVWPHLYPHIICICTTFYSLTFPFLTPIYYIILHQPWLFTTQTLYNFPLLLQNTRCSIGTSWEWTTTKILVERKRVTRRISDWVIKLKKRRR
jgi:hypothetical protein